MCKECHDPVACTFEIWDDGIAKSHLKEPFLQIIRGGREHGEPRVDVEEVELDLLPADKLAVRLGVLCEGDGGAGPAVEQDGPVRVLVRLPVAADHLVDSLAHNRDVEGRNLYFVEFHALKGFVYSLCGICKFG